MKLRFILTVALLAIAFLPSVAVALLSLSPTSGMDFYARPQEASLRWWSALLSDEDWAVATINSATVAGFSAVTALVLAAPAVAAWRVRRTKVATLAINAITLAYLIPPVVLAVALYMTFVAVGLFDNLPGLAIAHLAITFPLAVFVLRQRLAEGSIAPYLTARALGAGESRALATWLLSSHRATIFAALAVAFMGSMSEAAITIMLTDVRTPTVPHQILSSIAQDISPTGYAAMTLWMLLIGAAAALMLRQPTSRGS